MYPLVFLIEDEASPVLRNLLHGNRYTVHTLPASETAVLESAEKRHPALFLLNASLEGSLNLCRLIRQNPRLERAPIVIVAEKDSEEDRIRGFEFGADDFLIKPLRPREVVARVNAVIRRSKIRQVAGTVQVGGIEVDPERYLLLVQGVRVDATATQVRLIEYLMRNEGRVFSRDQILDAVWSDSRFVTPRTIDVHVRRIRELIEPNPSKPTYLKTIRGAGYCFVGQQRRPTDSSNPPLWFPTHTDRRGYPITSKPPRFTSAS